MYVPIRGGVWVHGGQCEAILRDRRTDLRKVEQVGAGLSLKGGGLSEEKRRQLRCGGVPLPAMGAPRPAARQCWKEQDKAADSQAAVHSVSRSCHQMMGLTG